MISVWKSPGKTGQSQHENNRKFCAQGLTPLSQKVFEAANGLEIFTI